MPPIQSRLLRSRVTMASNFFKKKKKNRPSQEGNNSPLSASSSFFHSPLFLLYSFLSFLFVLCFKVLFLFIQHRFLYALLFLYSEQKRPNTETNTHTLFSLLSRGISRNTLPVKQKKKSKQSTHSHTYTILNRDIVTHPP